MPYGSEARRESRGAFRSYLTDLSDEVITSDPITQSVADFVRTQHSRASFSHARLGSDVAAFDRDLTERLAPYADVAGNLIFHTRTRVTLGRLRPEVAT